MKMYNKVYDKVRVLGVPFNVLTVIFFIAMISIFAIEIGAMGISIFWVFGMAVIFFAISFFVFKDKDDHYIQNRFRFSADTKGVYRR